MILVHAHDGRVGMIAWNDRVGPILSECDGRKRCNSGKNTHSCVRVYGAAV